MTNCYYCEEKIKGFPYRCKFCGMLFCAKHRLPEYHKCPFDLRKVPVIESNSQISHIRYQDALDFMNNGFTVAKIYEYVTTKRLSRSEAVNLLSYFLERNDDIEVRKNTIIAFKLLNLKSNTVFSILESCVLSDESPIIRKIAIEVIKEIFPKKSAELVNWLNEQNNQEKK